MDEAAEYGMAHLRDSGKTPAGKLLRDSNFRSEPALIRRDSDPPLENVTDEECDSCGPEKQPPIAKPEWLPDHAQIRCFTCRIPFGLLIRKHHCRLCGYIFCDNCTSLRASFPSWFGYEGPQRVCSACAPKLFRYRGLSSSSDGDCSHKKTSSPSMQVDRSVSAMSRETTVEKEESPPGQQRSITRAMSSERTAVAKSEALKKHNVTPEGFYTLSDHTVSMPLRMLDPICKVAFWWSGMYSGGKFNRSLMQRAANFGVPLLLMEKVGSIQQGHVVVLYDWPSYEDEDSWNELKKVYPLDRDSPYRSSALQAIYKTFKMKFLVFTPVVGDGPFPVLLWFHGGGFCLGSIENQVYQMICRFLANKAGCVVVSVEYRLAPDFKFPTQVEDAYMALQYVCRKAEKLNVDRSRIAVGGDSAGGSLSALLTILSKERRGPEICHQVLVYPCLTSPLTDDLPSHVEYKAGPVLSRDVVEWFMEQLFDDKEKWLNHPLAMPLIYKDLSGLPPATIINAQHDPLRDHGKIYQERLREAGVPVTRSVYTKSLHGFFGTTFGESDEAMMEAAIALRHAFHTDR
mmetsp:Transcript_20142/g.77105  ORF Transcript_20142/g.77105 Transcript_20142/m.77105 type:complete len:572 (-) Transcript_20142:29-1744(-)